MSRRTTATLSRERVLRAGLAVIDREGVDALTMRKLGHELGVKAMSLYSYVDSKQDLLDGVLDCVYAEVPRYVGNGAASPSSWQSQLRGMARLFRQVLLRHPNTVPLVAARPVIAETARLSFARSVVAELTRAGLDVVSASAVVTVVLSFTVGHVASEVGRATEATQGEPPNSDTEFALGLDFIVAGVEDLIHPVAATG